MRSLTDKYAKFSSTVLDTLGAVFHVSNKRVPDQAKILGRRKLDPVTENILKDRPKLISALGILLYTNDIASKLPSISGLSMKDFFEVIGTFEIVTMEHIPHQHLFEYYCKNNSKKDKKGNPRPPLIKMMQDRQLSWTPRSLFIGFAEAAQTRNLIRFTTLTEYSKPQKIDNIREMPVGNPKSLTLFLNQVMGSDGIAKHRQYAIYVPDGGMIDSSFQGPLVMDLYQKNRQMTETTFGYSDYEIFLDGKVFSMTDLFLMDTFAYCSNMQIKSKGKVNKKN